MSRRLRVLLVQLPVPNNPLLNTPLAAGYLKAYAAAQGVLEDVDVVLLPRYVADVAGDALLVSWVVAFEPDVVGFSLYTWNSERSLSVAERVKVALPGVQVVVGGPEVQRDNAWVVEHAAVDVAVFGEGEQTFVELLRCWRAWLCCDGGWGAAGVGGLAGVCGVGYRVGSEVRFTESRSPLDSLEGIPSPYLAGYLDVPVDGVLMVEVSRWCPYACGFCLYGRGAGAKLGGRFFSLERVLAEIAWGRARGVRRVHFVEANLNLVPLFQPLMQALAVLNADRWLSFYAELRAEHVSDAVVSALDRANVRFVEVGLQSANLAALRASQRRTDLVRWSAGVRRLLAYGITIFLDVILGLPEDDAAGVAETLAFIAQESLGAYDVFVLQVLPGTLVRQEAGRYLMRFQDRPPYYVLGTDRLGYADLRRLRRDLRAGAQVVSDVVEGVPEPRRDALVRRVMGMPGEMITQVWLLDASWMGWDVGGAQWVAAHVDVVVGVAELERCGGLLAEVIAQNPTTVVDVYLWCAGAPPAADMLAMWRAGLPYQPGYLDRVAVYRQVEPGVAHWRVSPRCFLVVPWVVVVEEVVYAEVASLIWYVVLDEGEVVPFGAWAGAGGAGIALGFAVGCSEGYRAGVWAQVRVWEREYGRVVWSADALVVVG